MYLGVSGSFLCCVLYVVVVGDVGSSLCLLAGIGIRSGGSREDS